MRTIERMRSVAGAASAAVILCGASGAQDTGVSGLAMGVRKQLDRGIPVEVVRMGVAEASTGTVTFGVPLPAGVIGADRGLRLLKGGEPVPCRVTIASRWPDGSVRVCHLQCPVGPLVDGKEAVTLRAGASSAAAEPRETKFAFRDDVLVRLPLDLYCDSGVFGPLMTGRRNTVAPQLEERMAARSREMTGAAFDMERHGYYDRAHAQHMVFVRTGIPAAWFDARRWAVYYAQEHGKWLKQHREGREIAWRRLRRMYVQGLVEDYILTGDPESFNAARTLADAYCRSLRANMRDFRVNERNPSFPIIGLLCFYELTGEERYLTAARKVVDIVCDWRSQSRGGWIRIYEDKDECDDPNVRGGSPFMSTLLMEGLIHYYRLRPEPKVREAILGCVDWAFTECWWPSLGRPNARTFCYIQAPPPGRGETYDLNMMFLEMFGYAYHLTGRRDYRDVASQLIEGGLLGFGSHGKSFNQAMRGCSRGLYWLQVPPARGAGGGQVGDTGGGERK